ncbi:MAG: hypothetical protein NC177_06490 [Ruminococcus flavefaciens]|nr:hypothetical protein [Ruminococcus flavefaciens]
MAEYKNCVLLPEETRILWKSPYINDKAYVYGLSHSAECVYEEKIINYPAELIEKINRYSGENWIDRQPD